MKTNRDILTSICIYDLLMNINKNTGICPIRAVAGISKEEKLSLCYRYVHDGCEKCIQEWLNSEFSTDFSR